MTESFDSRITELTSLKSNYNSNDMKRIMKELSDSLNIKYNFFKHQSKVGDINDRWAEKVYLKFIRVIHRTVLETIPNIKMSYIENPNINRTINEKVLYDISKLSKSIGNHFKYDRIRNICDEIDILINNYKKFQELVDSKKCTKKDVEDIENYLLKVIKEKLPEQEQKKGPIVNSIHEDLKGRGQVMLMLLSMMNRTNIF